MYVSLIPLREILWQQQLSFVSCISQSVLHNAEYLLGY